MSIDIQIPHALLPGDGRFGSGPTRVRSEALGSLLSTGTGYLGTSHRKDPVKSVVRRIRTGLADLYSLPEGYEVVLGVGGATAFWDAAAFGLIESRSQHLVFGEFSGKFAAAVEKAAHLRPPMIIESPPGTHPDPIADDSIDAYAFTHNETTTGVVMSITRPGPSGIVLVDATSAAGAIEVDTAAFDAYYFSPQKAFGSEGGLWVALMSPAATDRVAAVAATGRPVPPFLDLSVAVDNSRKDQTYNTPALTTLYLLAEQIDWMLGNGGLQWAVDRSNENASVVYSWATSTAYTSPFVGDPDLRSPVTATIDFMEVDALEVAAVLRRNGIVDVDPYRKLGRNQLRIGLWPAIPTSDVEALLASIDYVVTAMQS